MLTYQVAQETHKWIVSYKLVMPVNMARETHVILFEGENIYWKIYDKTGFMQIRLKLHQAKYACRYSLGNFSYKVSSYHHNSIVLAQYSLVCNSALQDPLTKSKNC